MATYEVELPSGEVYEIEAPDDADVSAVVSQLTGKQPDQAQQDPQQPAKPYDPMSDAPRLPGEEGFDRPNTQPMSDAYSTVGKSVARYGRNVNEAAGALNRANGSGFVGALETAGTLVTGAVSPLTALAKHAVRGESPTPQTMDQYSRDLTYSPRTEQGKAQVGLLAAAAAPLSESGADVALLPLAGANLRVAPSAPKTKPVAVPTTQELSSAAKASYKTAKDAGVVLKPESFTKAVASAKEVAKSEGFHPRLHPKAGVVLDELDAAIDEGQPISLERMEQLRRVAKGAEKSIEPDERRIASIIVDQMDEYIDAIGGSDTIAGDGPRAAKALSDARALYTRNRKSAEIEGLIERAKERSSQFSGSGLENALRTEFRQLAMNDKRMRRFSKGEQDAIRHVSRGGKLENSLRYLGKLAPTGGLSAWLSILGTSLNPAIAAAPLTGLAARAGATKLTMSNATRAAEMMRKGPDVESQPPAMAEAAVGQIGNRTSPAIRSPETIQQEMARLEAVAQKLPENKQSSARAKAIQKKLEQLQSELASVSSPASSL